MKIPHREIARASQLIRAGPEQASRIGVFFI